MLFIMVKFDDSFMNLIYRFYGDQSLWWIIFQDLNDFKGRTKFTI